MPGSRDDARIRLSLLAAMGLSMLGCGPTIGDTPSNGGTDSGTTEESSTGVADASQSGGPPATSSSGADEGSSSEGSESTGPAQPPECVPILQAGVPDAPPTGFELCGSLVHRAAIVTCEAPSPGGDACALDNQPCATDEDCTDRAHGRCVDRGSSCGCVYGCTTDSDCPTGTLCMCGGDGVPEAYPALYPTSTQCTPASCTSSETCNGELCRLGSADSGCGPFFTVACATSDDTCTSNDTCVLPPFFSVVACWPYDAIAEPPYVDGTWDCQGFGQC